MKPFPETPARLAEFITPALVEVTPNKGLHPLPGVQPCHSGEGD